MQKWFTSGSKVVPKWFQSGSRMVLASLPRGPDVMRPGISARTHRTTYGIESTVRTDGAWAGPPVATSGSKVVHTWFQNGSKVVPKWFRSGLGIGARRENAQARPHEGGNVVPAWTDCCAYIDMRHWHAISVRYVCAPSRCAPSIGAKFGWAWSRSGSPAVQR